MWQAEFRYCVVYKRDSKRNAYVNTSRIGQAVFKYNFVMRMMRVRHIEEFHKIHIEAKQFAAHCFILLI